MYVDLCLPEMGCLSKVFKHEITYRIHLSKNLVLKDSFPAFPNKVGKRGN